MTLTIAQLEEAIIALRYAADGGVFVTGDRLFVEAVKPLEAEIELLEQAKTARETCRSCEMWIYTTDDHLSWCRNSNWLPPQEGK